MPETVVENAHSYYAIKLKEIVSRYREASYKLSDIVKVISLAN